MRDVQTCQSEPAPGGPADAAQPSTQPAADFRTWFEEERRWVDHAISTHLKTLKQDGETHSRLLDAVEYSLTQGGKRLRPVLVLESCRISGGAPEDARWAAIAMECVHTFSLIHDDLPAMDDDDLRRGVPTNHKVFGEATAILAGDWLLAHAFNLLAQANVPAAGIVSLVGSLASGTKDMVAGQAADIEGEDHPPQVDRVRYIHLNKTSRLIETSCRLGACCGGATDEASGRLAAYGGHLGLAFQIVDDLLDLTSSTAALGKRVHKDAEGDKQTYPAVFGLEVSRQEAERQTRAAIAALEPFGARADRLRDLARFVITRSN